MKHNKGFTLIEVLVYLGLFSIIIVGLFASALMVLQGYDRTQTRAMLEEEGNFLLAKINWALNGATSVSIGVSPLTLTITRAFSPTSVIFDQNLNINTGAGLKIINNSNASVSGISYIDSGAGTSVESVAISFTLNTKTPNGLSLSQDFTTTKYIRK